MRCTQFLFAAPDTTNQQNPPDVYTSTPPPLVRPNKHTSTHLVGQVCPAAEALEVVDQQVLEASHCWGLAAHSHGGAALVVVGLLALELWGGRGTMVGMERGRRNAGSQGADRQW